jgi:tricorn protease
MKSRSLLLLLLGCSALSGATLFRSPTVNQTVIVFAYAGDLWSVLRTGGDAIRLTSSRGVDANPLFSPDGTMIAFTGQYDDNTDVYVIPAAGGVPKRLTYHPGIDIASGWTPDSKRVLFYNAGSTHNGQPRLFTVGLEGGFPQEIPLPAGTMGSFSPDGSHLVYSPMARANQSWKNYRGGRATPLWIADLSDSSIARIPRTDSNDHTPMWIGNKIYFISDRDGNDSLFEYDLNSKKVTALVSSPKLDIKSASACSDAIVYEEFGEIHLLDLKTKRDSLVPIHVNGDLTGLRPRFINASKYIQNMGLSPTGARAVFEARGDIFTAPAEKGDIRNLTQSSGAADREPAWSPDGKWIAYFSDESGEYQLQLRDQTGRGTVKKLVLDPHPSFYYDLAWSPDSKKLAYVDKHLSAWWLDIDKGTPVKIDTTLFDEQWDVLRPVWSPDSKWIAYNRQLKSALAAVFVYSIETGKSTQITDGMSDARFATWDNNGKYLYFAASTDDGPTLVGLDLSNLSRSTTRSLYAVVLSLSDPSPFGPESDEEKAVIEEGAEKKDAAAKKDEKVEVKIDLDGISQRIVPLPVPARNYSQLASGKTGILFYLESPVSAAASSGPGDRSLQRFDLSKRKSELFLAGVRSFAVSANGEKVLVAKPENHYALVAAATPPKADEGALKLDGMETQIDPAAEWKQMFNEAWRIEREFFYDPHFHGLDLQAASERYSLYLKAVAHRSDLNYLLSEMLGQLSVGHMYIRGGDMGDESKAVKVGMLGADYKLENGRYRFARVFDGESWNPQTRAPLTQPGVNVKSGEYLLAVGGRELRDSDNVYAFFEGTAGKSVVLKVGPNPNSDGSREVTVVPVDNETSLRTLSWVEDNRRKVDQLSGGKLAYIHLPDTGNGGYTYFNRYYFAQTDKQGAIVDERYNRGGSAADYVIDHLRRPVWNYWSPRDGEIYTTPGKIIVGPKVMLANEWSGSGGDMLPWLFKSAKLGPLVGKRTWGGLVGIGGYPVLLDGGTVTAPHFGFFSPQGKWEVENHGTDPDYDVEFEPKAWRAGRDTQLEKAVELAMADLKKNPVGEPHRPAFPNYHKGTALGVSAGR